MPLPQLPLVIEPEQLQSILGTPDLLIIDLSKESTHQQAHVPGAIFLDYGSILLNHQKTMGLLPGSDQLTPLFSGLGIGDNTHVIAYDDEGGGKAARLLWTLEAMGHNKFSLLNGGLHSWANEGHPLTTDIASPTVQQFNARPTDAPVADAEYILSRLENPECQIVDARSPGEYQGMKRFAAKAGHIPGAVNIDWVLAMDQSRNMRLKSNKELESLLGNFCLDHKKETIVYCHTHHRSSLSYIMLKHMGYENVKGYPGSWSDWGNRSDTPTA